MGDMVREDLYQSAMNDSAAIGACVVFRQLEAMDYDDIIGSQ